IHEQTRAPTLGGMRSYDVRGMRFFFSSRRRHTRFSRDWSSDVCSSDLKIARQLIVKNATPPSSTILRPRRSDKGPRIAATNAPPNRKKDMEDGAHELLTPKSRVIASMAG